MNVPRNTALTPTSPNLMNVPRSDVALLGGTRDSVTRTLYQMAMDRLVTCMRNETQKEIIVYNKIQNKTQVEWGRTLGIGVRLG